MISFLGTLWSEVLRRIIHEATDGEVDIFLWTKCKLAYFIMYFGFNYSSALLVIISVEKFLALYFPFKTKSICTVRIARRVSLVTGVIFLAWDSQFFILGKAKFNIFGQKYCDYGNVSLDYTKILWGILIPTSYSYGPFAIMILANFAIIYKFMVAKCRNRNGNTESTNQALSKSATRGTTMLLTISFTFIILTGPIVLLNSIWPEEDYPDLAFKITITLQYLNHGINGILYCCSGSRFRNELKKLFRSDRSDSNLNPTCVSSGVLNVGQSNSTDISEVGSTPSPT